MKKKLIGITILSLCLLWINLEIANAAESTIVSKKVSLISGNEKITYLRLENTHTRSYNDIFSGIKHNLKENVEGVFWKIMCVGIKMENPFDKVVLQNEKKIIFSPITNIIETSGNSKGTDKDGNVIFQGPTTTFFLAGPDNSQEVTIKFGKTSVKLDFID